MSKQPNQQANPRPAPLIAPWGRPFAIAAAIVFFISLLFPVIACLSKNTASFPKWWGTLDVGLAFFLAILTFVIFALAGVGVPKWAEDSSYRAYRILTHGILVIIVLFLLSGDRITWINGLPGIAWRTCIPQT